MGLGSMARGSASRGTMATDPVCGMYVDEGTHLTALVRGRRYYFCSHTCMEAFTAPEKEIHRLRWLALFSLGVGIPLFVVGFGQSFGWWLVGTEEPLNLAFFVSPRRSSSLRDCVSSTAHGTHSRTAARTWTC